MYLWATKASNSFLIEITRLLIILLGISIYSTNFELFSAVSVWGGGGGEGGGDCSLGQFGGGGGRDSSLDPLCTIILSHLCLYSCCSKFESLRFHLIKSGHQHRVLSNIYSIYIHTIHFSTKYPTKKKLK